MTLNVLLTGGSGFIGRNVLESYLVEKYNIIAPKRSELDLLDDDNVARFFEKNKIDVIIHSAIKPGHRNAKDPSNLFYADSRMFFNIVRYSKLFNKLIVLSSGSAYDASQDLRKVDEDFFGKSMPADENGFFRYVSGKFMENMDNPIELRIFGIFGKYEDYAVRFISNAICKAIYDIPITIKQNRNFDYLWIDDLMPILDLYIQQDNLKYKTYNITPDESIELYEVAEKVRKISSKDLPIIVGKPGIGLEYSGSNKRLRSEMPDLKLTNIDDSIRQLYQWYSENKHTINRDLLLFDK